MSGERILIADDDVRNVEFLRDSLLAPGGYATLCASDGEEALRLALDRDPDLIILDLQMPKMDGLAVLEALRREGRQIPTIITTAHGSESVAVQAFRLGVRDYFRKPFRVAEIMQAVDRALVEARLRREKEVLAAEVQSVNRQLEQRVRELSILYSISKSVSSLLDLDKLLIRIVEAARYLTSAEKVSLYLLDQRTQKVHLRATQSAADRRVRKAKGEAGDSVVKESLDTGELAISHAARPDDPGRDTWTVSVPLNFRETAIGALSIQSKQGEPLTDSDRYLLSALAEYAAIAIENARLYDEVQAELAQRKQAEENIRQLAYHDTLTGLANRTLFNELLGVAFARARRHKHKVAVLMLDLDRFKVVNDTLGHSVGDELLKAVGKRLTALLRESDTVSRMGGDEFLLLLPEMERIEYAARAAGRILQAVREPFVLDGVTIHVSTSIGVAIYPDDGKDGDTLVKKADIAMYRAKDLGRDNYQRYSEGLPDNHAMPPRSQRPVPRTEGERNGMSL
jgi:diguanylate cyclase (GGDEF)-like protein